MLFIDDIVLVNETKKSASCKLEQCQEMELRCFKINQSKIKYMECNFCTNKIMRCTINLEEKESLQVNA